MTTVNDLTAWLTQIWDEEEAAAQRAVGDVAAMEIDNYGHLTVPASWLLARIAADRQILAQRAQLTRDLGEASADPRRQMNLPIILNVALALDTTIKHLASAHADRPGYKEEWKP